MYGEFVSEWIHACLFKLQQTRAWCPRMPPWGQTRYRPLVGGRPPWRKWLAISGSMVARPGEDVANTSYLNSSVACSHCVMCITSASCSSPIFCATSLQPPWRSPGANLASHVGPAHLAVFCKLQLTFWRSEASQLTALPQSIHLAIHLVLMQLFVSRSDYGVCNFGTFGRHVYWMGLH